MLAVSSPLIGQEELDAIKPVFESGWLGLGSTTYAFEKAVSKFLGAKNVIAVNTGTSALHLALDAFGVGKGDEVIVPSLTFAATIQPIISLGATPVFCEVYEQDLLIDLDDVECRVRSGSDGCSCDCGGEIKRPGLQSRFLNRCRRSCGEIVDHQRKYLKRSNLSGPGVLKESGNIRS